MNWQNDRVSRFYVGAALIGAALCLALFLLRAQSAFSFLIPLQLHTTGDEFTNYFNIWKQMHGEAVYSSRFEIPFSAAIYNWLFYASYAEFGRVGLWLFSLDEAWLPTVWRWFTVLGAMAGSGVAYGLFARALPGQSGREKALAAAFAIYLMFGPLLGFWSMTVRADVWAMTLEILGSALFLKFYPTKRLRAVLMLAACVYLAWSFKQSNVHAAAGAGILLLARRDWKALALLVTVLPAAWAVTFAVGPSDWASYILFKDLALFFQVERLIRNLINVGVKIGPVLFFLAALMFRASRSSTLRCGLWRNNAFVFGTGASLVVTAMSIPMSAQHGGAENYFFTLSFFLSLMVMASIPALRQESSAGIRSVLVSGSIGWITAVAATSAVLLGLVGTIDIRKQHHHYTLLKRCADALPRPLFVANPFAGLPWMTPDNIPWVLYYTYHEERALGRSFAGGGIGGMIERGEFAAIAVNLAPDGSFDGAHPLRYRQIDMPDCGDLSVFLRRPETDNR
jgi:hypothetical protein